MDVDNRALRVSIIECAREMNRRGINVNKSGNVSAFALDDKGKKGFLITPTGIPYEVLEPEDIVWVSLEHGASNEMMKGHRTPSSEWEMHARVYLMRSDVSAVVHTHSCYATALACQDMGIPPFHYMVAMAGGKSIDVAPYATFGTTELAKIAAQALAQKNACLLSHHGVLTCARSLQDALTLAAEVENLARQYTIVLSLGKPKLIPGEEMEKILVKFGTYGKQSQQCDQKEE